MRTLCRLKVLKATERMILEEAERSSVLRVNRTASCIAPNLVPKTTNQDHGTDARTIYIDTVGVMDDHDSLRRVFASFGKVNLVSLPRFSQNRKFKGFGFVEFADAVAVDEAVANLSNVDLRGIRVMKKTRWLDIKEQLKYRLAHGGRAEGSASDSAGLLCSPERNSLLNTAVTKTKEKKRRSPASTEHIHFGDDIDEVTTENEVTTKKQKV
uniref:RRM domain-containing protein n=1 Tax=Hyaloperonospora arabidopsidis (strain Emoy2) TaxID=559515 RepID=M4C2L6_HYAAE